MAAPLAAVMKVVQVAGTINNATKKDDENGSGLIKLICIALAAIAFIISLLVTVATSPFEWSDPDLQQFQQKYSYIFSFTPGVVYTESEIRHLIDPRSLSEERKEILRQGLSLVGRVSYFWGGKSSAVGWDERWGQLKKVTAAGSSTTGSVIPFGLDCTGYVDWVMLNAGVDTYPALYAYDWGELLTAKDLIPGDLAFVSDDSDNGISHVGIYYGTDANGKRLFLHCAGSSGVVLNSYSGFDLFARLHLGGE